MADTLQLRQVTEAPPAPAVATARTVLGHGLLLAGLFALLSLLYWGAVYAVGGQRGMPLDDSFIHIQYARSIWEGRPFEFNFATAPGIRSSGTSAPLWTVMTAGAYWFTRDWLTAAYVLGVVWTVPCVALAYWLVLRWTGKTAWALFAGAILLLSHPTIISAYEGMEPAGYAALFLAGLLCYDLSRTASGRRSPVVDRPRGAHAALAPGPDEAAPDGRAAVAWRLAASALWAITVWLRPEFLVMPAIVAVERLVTLRRQGRGWSGRWLREMALHTIVWALCILPYLAFNQWISGTLLPNTYTIKALARNSTGAMRFMAGLPSAWIHRDGWAALRCLTLWPATMALSAVIGLWMSNAVLAKRLPQAFRQSGRGGLGPAGLLAGISLVSLPMIRSLVDPLGLFIFQYQRYFAQATALMVVLGVAVLAAQAAAPDRRLVVRAVVASLLGGLIWNLQAVKAVDNINDMQVRIGNWLNHNTPAGSAVAANDVGAIAFYSQRRIIDTVGLTEPALARFYLDGGTLEQYLRREKPRYACLFPKWHDRLAKRADLFERLFEVDLNRGILDRNVICGGSSMWVLRTCWDKDARGK